MKFRIPFHYVAQFRWHRARVLRTALLAAQMDVDIEEVENPGPPWLVLGCERSQQPTHCGWQPFLYRDGAPVRVWRMENRNFVEFCPAADFVKIISSERNNPFDAKIEGGSTLPLISMGQTVTTYEDLSAQCMIKVWQDDGGEARSAFISRRAAAMRIIDGSVCVQVNDPVVVVSELYGAVQIGFSETHRDLGDGVDVTHDDWWGRRFSIDRFGEAMRYAADQASQPGGRLGRLPMLSSIGTTVPLLAQEGEHLHQTAQALISVYVPPKIQITDAWFAFEVAWKKCPLEHATEDLAYAIEVLLVELSRHMTIAEWPPAGSQRCSIDNNGMRQLRDLDYELPELAAKAAVDVIQWRRRLVGDNDWADRAIPIPTLHRNLIYQVLSKLELRKVMAQLQIADRGLEHEHLEGNLLFSQQAPDGKRRIVVVSPELAIKGVVGAFGVRHVSQGRSEMEAFLADNVCQRMELAALARAI